MDVGKWLDDIGLGKYALVFETHEIDRTALPEITEDDLKEMGLPIGARRKFLREQPNFVVGKDEDADGGQATPGDAERRQITVMFCDIVGSTALSETLDPETLRDLMAAYQRRAGEIVESFDGHVAQYLGDGLMVYFGFPIAHEDDAVRAVRAALDIVVGVKAIEAPVSLQVRIGIATGPVVVGETGRGDAAVPKAAVGETPNRAARLQGLAEPDQIVVGPTTYALAGGNFDYEDLGPTNLKGIEHPINVWRVTGASAAQSSFEARAARGLTPFVGREVESALLRDRWADTKAGEGQVIVLSGEPGIGKSRITQQLIEDLADEDYTLARYQCSPYYTNTAFYPIVAHLERAAGFLGEDSNDVRLDKLEALLQWSADDTAQSMALIALLMSLDPSRYGALSLTPQRTKERTLDLIAEISVSLSRRSPLMMIFEDVHWSDPTTIEVLSTLIDQLEASSVLLVITCRPEFEPPWTQYSNVTFHSLTRLSKRHGAHLVAQVDGGEQLPDSLLEDIIDKADGIPLFVEELTKSVLESGASVINSAMDTGPVVPATLHDILMARLDRLGQAKEIAQLGACVGRDFSHAMITALWSADEADLATGLQSLITVGLLHSHGHPPHGSYSFKHALVQDAAYQSLLLKRREQIHLAIAQSLNAPTDDSINPEPELLARHYSLAGKDEEAFPFWQLAGERAAKRSANTEAISHYTRALEMLASFPASEQRDLQELALQMALGTATDVSKGFAAPEAGQAYARAEALCASLGNRPELINVLMGLWAYHVSGQSHLNVGREIAASMLSLAREQDENTALLKANIIFPINLFYQGEFEAALNHMHDAAGRYDAASHHQEMVLTSGYDRGIVNYSWMAMTEWMLGNPDKAIADVRQSLDYAEHCDHPYTIAVAQVYAAWVYAWRRDDRLALDHAEAGIALSTEHGFALTRAWGTIYANLARSRLASSDCQPEESETAAASFTNAGIGLWMPNILGALAETQLHTGESGKARTTIDDAIELSTRRGDTFFDGELYRLRGDILRQGDGTSDATIQQAAVDSYRRAIESALAQNARSFALRACNDLATCDPQAAHHRQLGDLYASFDEGHDTPDLQDAAQTLASAGI